MESAPNIMNNPLQSNQLRPPWVVHMKTDLLNSIGDAWPSEGKILQGTSETPEIHRILNRNTICRKLWIAVDWSGDWLALGHASPVEDVKHILPLRKEETTAIAPNFHP